MDIISKRFIDALDKLVKDRKGKSIRQIALKSGINPSQITAVKNGERGVPDNHLDYLQNVYLVNKDFIVNGQGDFYISEQNVNKEVNIKRVSMQNDNLNMFMVPLKAYGGFLSGYETHVYRDSLQKVSFPLIRGECFAFEVEGFSMTPDFKPGDWFVGSRLEELNWLVKGRPYVFVTVNGIILKIFQEIKNDYMILRSANDEYNPVPSIHLKEVKGVFHKEAVVKL